MSFEKDSYFREELSGVIFTGDMASDLVFDECVFAACTFTGTRFEKCRFLNCKFTGCDLSNVIPMNSEFREVKFSDCKAIGIDWTRTAKIKGLRFNNCLVNY